MSVATVADLEAKILAGESVSPSDLATSRQHEDAAQRIEELNEQRAERARRDAARAETQKKFDDLKRSFTTIVKEGQQVQEMLDQIRAYPLKIKQAAAEHNRRVRILRADAGRLQQAEFGKDHNYALEEFTGGVSLEGVRVDQTIDWASQMRNALEDGFRDSNSWNPEDGEAV